MAKKPKVVGSIPADLLAASKDNLGHFLLQVLSHEVGAAVRSELLGSQLKACVVGFAAAAASLEEAKKDPMVQRYEQLWDEEKAAAETLVEDHVLIFFTASQLYVRRVQEAVRGFKLYENGHYKLPRYYESELLIRGFGPHVVGDLTIADCVWHLGNYAKHRDEIYEMHESTIEGLQKLGVTDANGLSEQDGVELALGKIFGSPANSAETLEGSLRHITSALVHWAESVKDCLIDDLDVYRYDGDRGRTRRENAVFRKALESKLT